jgi:hypothetical protein
MRRPVQWIDREPGLQAALHELARVLRRARRRWIVTLLIAGGLTAAVVWTLSKKPQIYSSRAILRMAEGEMVDSRRSLLRGELEGYMWNVVFSQKIIYPILEELDLYPEWRELGEAEAVAAFREDVDVTVFRNFFLTAGTDDTRSARVAITYRGFDAALTVEVVERLADEVIEHERERHIRTTESMESQALRALEQIDIEIGRRELRKAEMLSRIADAEEHESRLLQVTVQRLDMEIQNYTVSLTQARNELTAAKVLRASPLAVEVARVRTPEIVTEDARKRKLFIVGALGFFLLLPTGAIVIGAFDTRVRNSEDVERIGLPVVGHVPAFRGDATGTLVDRLPKKRWWQRHRLD